MAVNRVPVLKRCRSLGMDPIYLGINKKSNRQLKRSNRKMSEYGLQLREKQKAKFIYGVLEKPFRNYYAKAKQMEGMTGENLMILLESRLDNVMFRMGFARTRKEARQIVDHKHVLVNGKQVNIPSYLVKAGDVIEIKEKHKDCQRYKDILEVTGGNMIPDWLEVDAENLKGTVKELPSREAIDVPVDEMLIVEFNSFNFASTSSRDLRPRLRTFIMSSGVLFVSSSTVLMPALFRQLYERTESSNSSMLISRTFSFSSSSFSILTSAD